MARTRSITALALVLALCAWSGTAGADDYSESDYRKGGAPDCEGSALCAVGSVQGEDLDRFKIFVASDPRLNGRELKLDDGIDGASLSGSVVLVQFARVVDKTMIDAKLVGPAAAPVAAEAKAKADVVAAPPKATPITQIDLARWKVTLPISKPGKPGSAMEVTDLVGFTMPPYFDVQPKSITFSASVKGARTSGSNYPRSELREMDGSGDEFDWTADQGGTLSATLAVLELPTRTSMAEGVAPAPIPIKAPAPGRIVIGQIHGPDDELCRLYYDNGVLYFNNDKSGPKQEQLSFALVSAAGDMSNIPLGKSFSYAIRVAGQQLEVVATYNGVTYRAEDSVGRFWRGKPLYFKAGAYVQAGEAGGGAREIGRGRGSVKFTKIEVKH